MPCRTQCVRIAAKGETETWRSRTDRRGLREQRGENRRRWVQCAKKWVQMENTICYTLRFQQTIVRLHIKFRPRILVVAGRCKCGGRHIRFHINHIVHCFLARHNQLPHDQKDSNNLRHADRNLAQNEVSRTHKPNFRLQLIFSLNFPYNEQYWQTSIVWFFFSVWLFVNLWIDAKTEVHFFGEREKSTKEYTISISLSREKEWPKKLNTPYNLSGFQNGFNLILHLKNVDYERQKCAFVFHSSATRPARHKSLASAADMLFSQLILIKIAWEVHKKICTISWRLNRGVRPKSKCTRFKWRNEMKRTWRRERRNEEHVLDPGLSV